MILPVLALGQSVYSYLVKGLVVDSEVVRDLMDDRGPDFCYDLFVGTADALDRALEQRDFVRRTRL